MDVENQPGAKRRPDQSPSQVNILSRFKLACVAFLQTATFRTSHPFSSVALAHGSFGAKYQPTD